MKTITTQKEAYEMRESFAKFIDYALDELPSVDSIAVTRDTVQNFLDRQKANIYKSRENFSAKNPNEAALCGFKFYDLHSPKFHQHLYILDLGEFRLCYIN